MKERFPTPVTSMSPKTGSDSEQVLSNWTDLPELGQSIAQGKSQMKSLQADTVSGLNNTLFSSVTRGDDEIAVNTQAFSRHTFMVAKNV